MSGKFMKVKRIAIPMLTMLLIASQLTGCASASESDMLNMINNQQMITIEVAVPENQEQGEEITFEWLELAYLNNYETFRLEMDDLLMITPFLTGGKNGTIYTDLDGNHTNNSTLYYALMNNKFREQISNSDIKSKLGSLVKELYSDVEDKHIEAAYINAYFNLINDAEPNYFNGNSTVSRAEFLTALYKSNKPVSEIGINTELQMLVGYENNENTLPFVSQMLDNSYLSITDKSLNDQTYNGTITRAEAIYSVVKMLYSEELEQVDIKSKAFEDTKNAGDIASEQKFIEKGQTKDYCKSYVVQYCIDNADKGLDEELYKAMVVAKNKGLITDNKSRWDEGLTKAEAIELIMDAYELKTSTLSVDRGSKTFTWEELCNMDLDLTIDEINNKLSSSNIIHNEDGSISPNADWIMGVKEYAGDYLNTATENQVIRFVEFIMTYTVAEGKDSPEDIKQLIDDTKNNGLGGIDMQFPDYNKTPEDYLPDNLKDTENKTDEELEEIFQEIEKENYEKFVEEQKKIEQETSQPDKSTTGNQTEPESEDIPEWAQNQGWGDLFTEEEIKEHNERMEQAIENAENFNPSQEEVEDFLKNFN